MGNKNLRRLRCLVTAPTMCNLERLAQMEGSQSVGKVVDKLVREDDIPAPAARPMGSPLPDQV